MKRLRWQLFTLLMLTTLGCHASPAPLTLGVHPYLPATELTQRFKPLVDYLGRQLQRPAHIKIAQTYGEHLSNLASNQVDFAFFGPSLYLKAVEQYGKPKLLARLAKDGKAGLKGMIILREESKIEKLSQLKGKRFAFGDANSTLGTQVPAALLADAGVELEQLGDYNYLKNHNNVALGVLMGKYDAGGVKEEVFIRYRERGLKTLTTTPIITSHAFVASYRLESDTFQQLQNLLLQLHKGPEGQKILDQIKRGTTQLIPASDADYDSLRHILHAGAIQ